MLDLSLGASAQLVAPSLLRVQWEWKSAGALNGRKLKRVECFSLGAKRLEWAHPNNSLDPTAR
jgi:hypothetical protein